MRMPKVGDKVRILSTTDDYCMSAVGLEFTVGRVEDSAIFVVDTELLPDGYRGSYAFSSNDEKWEIVSEANPEKSSTTTAEVEMQEVQDITHSISEAIFYDGFEAPKVLAKANDVVGALITIMVAKGIITKQDVKRILASPRPSV